MFGALYLVDGSADGLLDVARDFTPRVEICGPGDLLLDLGGLTRLFGHPRAVAQELRRAAAARGLRIGVALAPTGTAARLLARHTPFTVIEPGAEAAAVAPLPLTLLADITNAPPSPLRGFGEASPRTVAPPHDLLSTFRRWGLRTLGDLAALPADEVAARLGIDGLRWHRLAEARDLRPLRPVVPEERFEQALDLEWPIEGLEPLSFVLGRLLEPLAAHLERRGRGAAVLHLRLHLVTRAVHERSLKLPAPMRDPRTLRTLLLLDLESHPAPAAIDRVVVAADPTPARVLQCSLLHRPLPSPERLSTLTARLSALMGDGRCGSPAVVDSWQPGAFGVKAFEPSETGGVYAHGTPRHRGTEIHKGFVPNSLGVSASRCSVGANGAANHPAVALRRFQFPIPARVRVENDRPVRVTTDRVAKRPDKPALAGRSASADRPGVSGGRVQACAGPWRTSGHWWIEPGSGIGEGRTVHAPIPDPRSPVWDRDEWDVTLGDHATYRVFRDRGTGAWFLEGIYD